MVATINFVPGDTVRVFQKIRLVIVNSPADQKGFVVQKKRWIVERTFGWINRYRRLSKDYEFLTQSSQAMIYAVMSNLIVLRLARFYHRTCNGTD